MRTTIWAGLCAAAALMLPVVASAQDKPAPPTADQIKKGQADAPALVQAAGARCSIANAAFRGSGTSGKNKVDIYETACSDGPGYLIIRTAGEPKPVAYPCLAVASQGTHCVLPENADAKPGLARLAAAAGRPCQVSDARYVGTSSTSGESYYELACSGAGGFRLGVSSAAGAKPDVAECLALIGTPQQCTFTTKEQALASLKPMIQAAGRTCALSDGRFIGASESTHQTYYEVACGSAPGFVVATDTATGQFKQAISCGQAAGIGGGCTLTSATMTASEDNARYSRLAAAAGFPCQVSRSRSLGQDNTGREAAEIACSNRPDGAVGLFASTPTGKSELYDCVKASSLNQTCQLTQPTAVYAKYSQALAAKGRASCSVSGARFIGVNGAGGDVIETACSDGKPGWVIYFKPGGDTVVSQLLSCSQSSNDGRPCQLPTNVAGNTVAPAATPRRKG